MGKVILNKCEYDRYIKYKELRETSEREFEKQVDRKYKDCQYYNDCGSCDLHHDSFTNIGCEFQLIMLADNDEAEVSCEDEEKIIFY